MIKEFTSGNNLKNLILAKNSFVIIFKPFFFSLKHILKAFNILSATIVKVFSKVPDDTLCSLPLLLFSFSKF